jgi:hypothetical protein
MTFEKPDSTDEIPAPRPPTVGSPGFYKLDVPDDAAVTVTTTVKAQEPNKQPKGCLAVIAVLVLMIGILVAGAIASDSLANEPPKPINLGQGVSLTAPWSWEYQGRSEDQNTVLLSRGNGSLAVTVEDQPNCMLELQSLIDEWTASGRVTVSEIQPVEDVRPGQQLLRFGYSGEFDDIAGPIEGEVTCAPGSNISVVFDGWSGYGDYVTNRDEIDTMIKGATIP